MLSVCCLFLIGTWIWNAWLGFRYQWVLVAVTLAADISFVDDIHYLPDSVRLVAKFVAMASLVPPFLLNRELGFVDESLIAVVAIADIVFCLFNFRPKGKAKCFAGDVGSIGIAYILLFLIGRLIRKRSLLQPFDFQWAFV